MADSPNTATAAKPAGNAAPAADKKARAPRTTPTAGEVVTEIPSSSRKGFWATEFEWFQAHPGVIRKYESVSPTTASYLRSEYGLEAHSRNAKDKRCDLYVKYDPATAEEIKNRPKRTRTAKAAPASK